MTLTLTLGACGDGDREEKSSPKAGDDSAARNARVQKGGRRAVELLGFSGFRLRLAHDDKTVTVTIPARQACTAGPKDDGRVRQALTGELTFVKRVAVRVADARSLSEYVKRNCKPRRLPEGAGRVIYQHSGKFGSFFSKPIRVRSRRAAVEYLNDGKNFTVIVFKGDQPQEQFIAVIGRTTGSKALKGPGTFRFQVFGAGYWTMRVREGE